MADATTNTIFKIFRTVLCIKKTSLASRDNKINENCAQLNNNLEWKNYALNIGDMVK